jgi:flagellar hook-associated protein 2
MSTSISQSTGSTLNSPITFSGLNGFDFTSIMNAQLQNDSIPMQNLQAQQAALQNKDAALTSLGTQISQLESTLTTLASQTAFTNVTATSSDNTIAGASSGDGAIAGSFDVTIANLAKSQVTASTTGYTNTTDVAADGGSISFTIGTQTTTPIQITGQTSLADLASQINSQNSGVTAAVVNDGTNYKLVVMSRQTGQAGGFTINNNLTNSSGTVVAFAAGQSPTSGNTQNALDASLTVNGLHVTSSTNTVTNAIPGVNLSLAKAGEATINVSPDYTSLQNTLNSLVLQYNSLLQFSNQQSATTNGQSGPLANDPVLRQVMADITNQLLASGNGGGQYHYLSELGLQLNSDGTLSLDTSTFQSAMATNPQDVQELFQGANGTNGLFQNFLNVLQADDNTSGLISSTLTSDKASNQGYIDEIAAQQERLNMEKDQLTKYYSAADQAMISLRAASQSLSQIGSTQSLF